eukprot:scaffold1247_cov170-Ochromonas_danica.AAC.10
MDGVQVGLEGRMANERTMHITAHLALVQYGHVADAALEHDLSAAPRRVVRRAVDDLLTARHNVGHFGGAQLFLEAAGRFVLVVVAHELEQVAGSDDAQHGAVGRHHQCRVELVVDEVCDAVARARSVRQCEVLLLQHLQQLSYPHLRPHRSHWGLLGGHFIDRHGLTLDAIFVEWVARDLNEPPGREGRGG